MSDDKVHERQHLTEEEKEEILRAGLKAAWDGLQPLKNDKIDLNQHIITAIRAFNSTQKMLEEKRKELERKHGACVYFWADTNHVFATACAMIVSRADIEDVDDYHPYSVAGSTIVVLMQATLFMAGANMMQYAFVESDDDNMEYIFGCMLEEQAEKMARILSRESKEN